MKMADTFKHAYAVFELEMARINQIPHPHTIAMLFIAVDADVKFDLGDPNNETITALFSDGSTVTLLDPTITKH